MMTVATISRLSAWLVGLYLIAQICAIVPLISCQSLRAATSESFSFSQSHDETTDIHILGHHHAGKADDATHRQALQDLNGVLTWLPNRITNTVNVVAFIPVAMRALVEADRVLPERPPKRLLPV